MFVSLVTACALWVMMCLSLRLRSSAVCSISIALLAFVLGVISYDEYEKSVRVDWPDESRDYSAVLQDWPVERDRSFLLKVRISDDCSPADGAGVYLYVPKTKNVSALRPGDGLRFHGIVKGTGADDGDSGYELYLYGKGISGTLWVSSSNWRKDDYVRSDKLKYRLARIRGKMSEMYAECGLSEKALAVVMSVMLADKSMLNDDTRNTFSASGASHLLAVSGLHVGIIYACLSLLLPSFASVSGRVLKELAIMALLWTYAAVIGMPLSITRSMIMFSVAFACHCLKRDNTSVNSLAVAAVAILAVDPNGLFDVSFQLSFLAVLFILMLQPAISGILKPENPIVAYFWNLMTVSVSAQLGTAPLVAYVFNALPAYFLITNIVAIPLMFVVVFCSILMWIGAVIPFVCRLLAAVISCSVDFLDNAMTLVVETPGAVFGTSIDCASEVWLAYMILFAISVWIVCRKPRSLIFAACAANLWVMLSVFNVC